MDPGGADWLEAGIVVVATFIFGMLIMDFPLIWGMVRYWLNPRRYRGKHRRQRFGNG
jgi:hypothetical protein